MTIKKSDVDTLNDEIKLALNTAVNNFVEKAGCRINHLDIGDLELHADYDGRFKLSLGADFHLKKIQ